MRSIRLSLIVYFLVLLALALGGVSWFAYATTAQTMRERQASTHDLVQSQYEHRCANIKVDFDRRLLTQAQTLAKRSRSTNPHVEPFYVLGALGTSMVPEGYLTAPLWLASGLHSRNEKNFGPGVAGYLYSHRVTVTVTSEDIEDDIIPKPDESQAQEYFQTFNWHGTTFQRSSSLGKESLVLSQEQHDRAEAFAGLFDEFDLADDTHVRRVTIKVSPRGFRPAFLPAAWTFLTAKTKGPKGGPPGRPFGIDPRFFGSVYIQYASGTKLMEDKLTEFARERDDKIAQTEADTRTALMGLRQRLFWICLATFAAIVCGGFLLVRLGLAPLSRLSDAVSQVSERDFRLRIVQQDLPMELQPIAARLAYTLEQLHRAFEREKQAAADISHELRTPLAAMMTNVELALRKSRTPEQYRELLQDIHASGEHMSSLVENLLALARLDAGADRLKLQAIDASVIASQCVNMVRPLAEARGIKLTCKAAEPIQMQADADKLREILTNLLHNAVEYNKPQGAIDLSVVRVNGHARLAVSDTGIGIKAEEKERIFERFFRADPSRHADSPHAGLGLSIVKSYVDLMGGTIGVDSNERGSTFIVELPVR